MSNKEKIINLVGASGSGKTTIAKELEVLGHNIIYSYTTREPREENEWGHTFIDYKNLRDNWTCDEVNAFYKNEEIVAYKEVYEGLYYFATKDQYKGKGTSIYVVCPDGAKQVKENVKDAEVITIFLNADEHDRWLRLQARENLPFSLIEGEKENKEYEEKILNRLRDDERIFKSLRCDYVVDANREIREVLRDIVGIIGVKE